MHKIKEAAIEDVPLLTRLIREAFRDVAKQFNLTPQNTPTHPSNCREDWVRSALAKGVRYYLLEDHERPCGCVALERAKPEVCYLERLAVLPAFRRKGFGEALVKRAAGEARRMGARRIEIGIIAAQTQLKNWYEKLGFVFLNTKHFDHLPFEVAFMAMPLYPEERCPGL